MKSFILFDRSKLCIQLDINFEVPVPCHRMGEPRPCRHFLSVESLPSEALPLRIYRCLCQFFAWNYASDFILRIHVSLTIYYERIWSGMMWRLQGSGAIFVCWVSVKLRLLFTAGPYWQVVSARCAVWIFIDLWKLRPQNACSLSFLRPALKICVKNADFCVDANPVYLCTEMILMTSTWYGLLVLSKGLTEAMEKADRQGQLDGSITWYIS